jgi:hypothetical protein
MEPDHSDGLYSSYKLQLGEYREPVEIPADIVARCYFCDPYDPRRVLAPLHAVIKPVRIDDRILTSQDQAFERGIFPNLVVSLGKMVGPTGEPTNRRPRLQGPQREQFMMALRQILSQNIRAGDPVIVDQMIESVHKIHTNPQEMDWLDSTEIMRKRIMMAFGLNKYAVGDTEDVNLANAVESEKQVATNVINPILSLLSDTADTFLSPRYEKPKRLVVWLEPMEPMDPERRFKIFSDGRKRDDITRDEFRAEIAQLPPLDEPEQTTLLKTVGGVQGGISIMTAAGAGEITPEAVKLMFEDFYKFEEARAQEYADASVVEEEEEEEPEPPPFPPPVNPFLPQPEGEPIEDEEEGEEGEQGADEEEEEEEEKKATRPQIIKRAIKQLHAAQALRIEEEMGQQLARHFPAVRE